MFLVGVDLGKRVDFAAVAVVERVEGVNRGFDWANWRPTVEPWRAGMSVRWLERMALGTPYPAVVKRVVEVCRHPRLLGRCRLVVDATGVGEAVVDMLRKAGPGCEMLPVWITAGARERFDGKSYRVPKEELLGGLQRALEEGELTIVKELKESGTLVRELLAMRVRASGPEHDDLAMAVALGVWAAGKAGVGERGGRLPGI